MELLTCKNCGAEFLGRSNRRYCGPHCQRRMERRRARWDRQNKRAEWIEARAAQASGAQRQNLIRWAKQVRERIGARP
jgi:hypothetical protein